MSVATRDASWTCSRCEMTVRWMPDCEQVRRPEGWSKRKDGHYCLLCRREMAGEAALRKIGEGGNLEERAKLRNEAVIEFEVRRSPERPDAEIAKVVRSSVAAVERARLRLNS